MTTFVHELGHAVVASKLLKVPVEIRLGKKFKGNGLTIGRLTVKVQAVSGWVGFFSYNVPPEKVNRAHNIAIFLAGPFSSLLLCCICFLLISYVSFPTAINFFMKSVMNAALVQFIITTIPIRYPSFFGAYRGISSDGYRVVKLLQRR
ncbi:site-2 protease family protein [Bacillus sp. AK128]